MPSNSSGTPLKASEIFLINLDTIEYFTILDVKKLASHLLKIRQLQGALPLIPPGALPLPTGHHWGRCTTHPDVGECLH